MKRAIEGCCSDNLDSDNLDQVFVFINEIISDLSFTFVNDLKEIWIQFISRVVLNEDYSKETRLVASEVNTIINKIKFKDYLVKTVFLLCLVWF